jgi:hypothetical protein
MIFNVVNIYSSNEPCVTKHLVSDNFLSNKKYGKAIQNMQPIFLVLCFLLSPSS